MKSITPDEIAAKFNPRTYSDHELERFHTKIQRFQEPAREISDTEIGGRVFKGGIAQKFRYEDLHVAFGAAKKVEHGRDPKGVILYKYLYVPDRYEVFNNLWRQYEDWRRKQDWIADKQAQDSARSSPEALSGSETGEVPF